MRIYLRLFFLVMSVFFLLSSVSAATGVCCYDGLNDANSIKPASGSCSEGEIVVGSFADDPRCDYDDDRLGCKVGSVCYATVLGYTIYDFNEVMSFFENNLDIDLENYCSDGLVPYDSNSCSVDYVVSSSGNIGGVITGDDSVSSSQVGEGVGSHWSSDFFIDLEDSGFQEYCIDSGGLFGFFATENSCNSITNDDGETYPCFYNPYLAGDLGVFFTESFLSIDDEEGGCVHKTSINICSDYKSKENCEDNLIFLDEVYTSDDLNSCRWVNTSDFFADFETNSGICVSNYVSEDSHFNIESYTSRMNLLSNPSFEEGSIGWNSEILDSLVVGVEDAYDGYNYLSLLGGTYLFQNVSFLGEGVGYVPLMYVMGNEEFLSSDYVEITIVEHYNDDTSFDFVYLEEIGDFIKSGVFYSLVFDEHVVSNNVNYIEFKVSGSADLKIDALSFEHYNADSTVIGGAIFKPVEVIDSSASICELCFNNENLNFCTEAKSDLMGDCSYMVDSYGDEYISDLTSYFGDKDNYLMDNKSSRWVSQSVANSLLFCEMYIDETSCIDGNNYVNSKFSSLHYMIDDGSTLCKWTDVYGCYKDSDNNDGPDVLGNLINKDVMGENVLPSSIYLDLYSSSDSEGYLDDGFDSLLFSSYLFETNLDLNRLSDFAYSCDILPPESYMYFEARNQSGDVFFLTDEELGFVVGGVDFNLQAYDIDLESCERFEIEDVLYVDYTVNGNSFYRKTIGSSLSEFVSIKDFFVNESGLLFKEGDNEVEVSVKDQSGNVGKVRSFVMDVDLNGPSITMLEDVNGVLGPETTLEILVTDYSKIESCSFSLELYEGVSSNEGVISNFYNSSGNLSDYSSLVVEDDSNILYDFDLPIYNTTSNENVYDLEILCVDVFEQETVENYMLYVDFNTEFLLQEPLGFINYLGDTGFLNLETLVWITSIEKNLNSCNFDFLNSAGVGHFNEPVTFNEGFVVEDYSSNTVFYTNITGVLDFESDGIHEVSMSCMDSLGNELSKSVTYYYDTVAPNLLDYSISSSGTSVFLDGSYYAIRGDTSVYSLGVNLDVELDGTGSWISNSFNVSYWNGTEFSGVIGGAQFSSPVLNESDYISNMSISNFDNLISYLGSDTAEENLYEQKYLLSFYDKAGNVGTSEINYFYDDSSVMFVFSGDVLGSSSQLYTMVNNPVFDVSFNAPNYRTFSCDLELLWHGLIYSQSFLDSNMIELNFASFIDGFDLSDLDSEVYFNFDCIDVYGVGLESTFTLSFDDTNPVLNDVYFESDNDIYLLNTGSNYLYNDLFDRLVFEFKDTLEEEYTCNYTFSSMDYVCNDDVFVVDLSGDDLKDKTSLFNLLGENDESICVRRSDFSDLLDASDSSGDALSTVIEVSTVCLDGVGLSTEIVESSIGINYVSNINFVDFDIGYVDGNIEFVTRSLSLFDEVIISLDDVVGDDLLVLTLEEESEYGNIYRGQLSIDNFDEGFSFEIWALGLGSTGVIWDKISGGFVVDKTAPEVSFVFPDMNEDNEIFSEEFEMRIAVLDNQGSKIDSVELYLGSELIYSDNLGNYSEDHIKKPDSVLNYFDYDSFTYQGRVIFKDAKIGDIYDFTLVVKDGAGNEKIVEQQVFIKDGVSIKIIDSEFSFVDVGGFSWLTKQYAPIVSFEVSKDEVSRCSLYPFVDEEWESIVGDDYIDVYSFVNGDEVSDRIFSFDLSSFEGFDLRSIDDKSVDLKIICIYNNTAYTYLRDISLIDSIPDYVLESSNGFVFNDNSYFTSLEITSVGAYRDISCEYEFDGVNAPLGVGYGDEFSLDLSFIHLESGTYEFSLSCVDSLGTKGPKKSYTFVVNKELGVLIEDINLFYGNLNYELSDAGVFYINKLSDVSLRLRSNKVDVDCNYEISKDGNIFIDVFRFVKNLFVDNLVEVSSTSVPYEFEAVFDFDFEEGGFYNLIVECSDRSGNIVNEQYGLEYVGNTEFEFDLGLVD